MKVALRHSGQSVYYDPASETVFAPFNQGGGATYSPFRISGDSLAGLNLKERTGGPTGDWNPPTDVRPILLGIHAPTAETCP